MRFAPPSPPWPEKWVCTFSSPPRSNRAPCPRGNRFGPCRESCRRALIPAAQGPDARPRASLHESPALVRPGLAPSRRATVTARPATMAPLNEGFAPGMVSRKPGSRRPPTRPAFVAAALCQSPALTQRLTSRLRSVFNPRPLRSTRGHEYDSNCWTRRGRSTRRVSGRTWRRCWARPPCGRNSGPNRSAIRWTS